MTAIIQASGKQYCLQPNKTITIDRLPHAEGEVVTFDNLLGGESVAVEIIRHELGDKVTSRKFRNKTRYTRTKGHRQPITIIKMVEAKPVKTKKTSEKSEEVA